MRISGDPILPLTRRTKVPLEDGLLGHHIVLTGHLEHRYRFHMGEAGSIASSDHIGRWGVMYVRTLLAQAAVVHSEVSGGEDHLAVDMSLTFPIGTVTAQIKTGKKQPNSDGSITVDVTDHWKRKWANTKQPVYLVYVQLDKQPASSWVSHAAAETTLHAYALWQRVNEVTGASVRLPAENRLTAASFEAWVDDFDSLWGKAASA